MSATLQQLFTALRIEWPALDRAVEFLAERAPGFTAEQYAEAHRCAVELDGLPWQLADAWFDSRGQGPYPTVEELRAKCPGFADSDYEEAIEKNILWARK